MALFPSFWDILLPSLSGMTAFGIILLFIGILGLLFTVNMTLKRWSGILVLAGVVLIWGFSILQDFITSTGGLIIFLGLLAVGVTWLLLFWEPKPKK